MGTPGYISPEQLYDAASVDHKADLFALGCTLYTLLTGRPAYVQQSRSRLACRGPGRGLRGM